jgi:hypothetical protein
MTNTLYAGKANSPAAKLLVPISALDVSATLDYGTYLPAAPNICTFGTGADAETVIYGAKVGNVISSLTRGVEGTAAPWGINTPVSRQYSNYDWQAAIDHITQLETDLLTRPAVLEGAFTPVVTFGGASVGITYTTNAGMYTKIGNIVHISGYILLSSKGSSTGTALIEGLPFVCANAPGANAAISVRLQAITFANQYSANIPINTATLALTEVTEAGAGSNLTNADFANNSIVIFGGSYRAA